MCEQQGFRECGSREDALDLPPFFRAVALGEGGEAFAHACKIAAAQGAGTLVHVETAAWADFALVLEPDEPVVTARRALHAGMLALANTLAALAPPEKPIALRWPDALVVDGGLVGGGRLGCPEGSDENAVPSWLVFAAKLRLRFPPGVEPGRFPTVTSLDEEGFGAMSGARLAEGFARHFMMLVDSWQQDGFGAVAQGYLDRLPRRAGERANLAANGDLLIERDRRAGERHSLRAALRKPSWLAAETGDPGL